MDHKNRTLSSISILLALILITACSPKIATPVSNLNSPPDQQSNVQESTQSPSTSDSSAVDACALLTKEDVSKVLGVPVLTAESSGLGGLCTYKTEKLEILFLTAGNTGGIKAMNTTQSRLGDLALVVPGLGDLAFYNTNSANALLLLKGDAEYNFNISDLNYQPLDPAYVQATEKALAEQLLSILK